MPTGENSEIQNTKAETDKPATTPPKPVERVKKDLPKKKWRKQGLRKSTRKR